MRSSQPAARPASQPPPKRACPQDAGVPSILWDPAERYKRFEEGVVGGAVGEGSYGKVYSALDKLLNQHVMIKRQPFRRNPLLERELLAFQALRAFPHKNVVKMLDYFVESRHGEDHLYMVFEALATDLLAIYMCTPLGRAGCRPCEETARHFLDIAAGVSHLHKLNLTHGDLSLGNVLIGVDGVCRVSDLGTAHSCHTLLSSCPGFRGTPYARSPEIWAGIPRSGPPADAWSVGVLALIMLTGEMPSGHNLRDERPDDDIPLRAWISSWTRILGPPREGTCPSLEELESWKHFVSDESVGPPGSLDAYLAVRPVDRPLGKSHPIVEIVATLLRWEPSDRSYLDEVCAALEVAYPLGAAAAAAASAASLAVAAACARAGSLAPPASAASTIAPPGEGCRCRGNCGWADCNMRTKAGPNGKDCPRPLVAGFRFCFRCKCDVRSCPDCRRGQIASPNKGRFCTLHTKAADAVDEDKIFTAAGIAFPVPKSWPRTTILACRWAYAFPFTYPHDATAHHYLAFPLLNRFPSGPIEDPSEKRAIGAVFACLFLANAMKWPNAVLPWADGLHRLPMAAFADLSGKSLVKDFVTMLEVVDSAEASEMHRRMNVGMVCIQTGNSRASSRPPPAPAPPGPPGPGPGPGRGRGGAGAGQM